MQQKFLELGPFLRKKCFIELPLVGFPIVNRHRSFTADSETLRSNNNFRNFIENSNLFESYPDSIWTRLGLDSSRALIKTHFQSTLSKQCYYEGRYETTQKVRSFHFLQK
jgi:hypothetical protein